jgi:hypothetical protein
MEIERIRELKYHERDPKKISALYDKIGTLENTIRHFEEPEAQLRALKGCLLCMEHLVTWKESAEYRLWKTLEPVDVDEDLSWVLNE